MREELGRALHESTTRSARKTRGTRRHAEIPNNAADDGKPHRPESISNVLQRFELDLDRYLITMRAAHATGTDRSASPRDAC